MAKYCAKCFGEFSNDIKTCPSDGEILTNNKPDQEIQSLTDIYAVGNAVEAERIVLFLREAKIAAQENKSEIAQLPSKSDTKFIIAVADEQQDEAKLRIEQAREDGIISKTGSFI